MPWAVAGGLLAAAGAVGSAVIGSNSASKAADASQNAADQATAEQRREYDQSRSDQLPWLNTGKNALDTLAGLYGVGSGAGATPDYSEFYKSPDYNFAMQQGIAGVDAGAAARGSLDSGATRKAETQYASNLASSNFNNYANRLAGLAGVGQNAANTLTSAGQNTANNVSNIIQNAGNSQASSYLAQGKSYADAVGSIAGIGSGLITNYGSRPSTPAPDPIAPVTVTPVNSQYWG